MLYIMYTDDSMIAGASQVEIDKVINLIKSTGLKLTKEGTIDDFVGVHIHRTPEGTFELSQETLINSILKNLHLDQESTTSKRTPVKVGPVLRHMKSHQNMMATSTTKVS